MNSPAQQQQESEARPDRLGDADMEDLLSAEFDKLAEADDGETEETTEEEEVEETTVSEEESEETTSEVDEESETEETAEEEVSVEEEAEYDEPAPERWPNELKEAYAALPPEMKQHVMERVFKPMQRQYTQTTQELSQMQKTVEPMVQTLDQYRNDFERMGVNPIEAFTTQVAWAAHFARVGPEKGIADMQAAYGLAKPEAGQQDEPYLTPVERDMKAQLDAMQQQLNQTSQGQQQFSEQQMQQQQQAWENEVRSGLHTFINETKDGKPAHPHVEKVAPAIAGLIRGGMIKKVDDFGQRIPIRDQMAQAYEMACNLDPSLRTAKTGKKQVAKAVAAQEVDVVTTTPAGQADEPELTLSEQIDRDYDRLNRRVG